MTGTDPLRRGLRFLKSRLLDPEYPLTAIEVRPRALGVVRLERQGHAVTLGAAASVDLPEGLVRLSISEPNLNDREAFTRVMGSVLERAGALKQGRVALVLPDPVARLALLPAAELGGRRGRELVEMVRFKLRKTVPFEIRSARIALLQPVRTADTVLVAAVSLPVLEGYEEVVRQVGLEPGLVELSSLSLLGARAADEETGDRLLVNWDNHYASLVVSRDGWPLLIRTLTEAAATPEALVAETAQTVLYYRERIGGPGLSGAVVRSAVLPPDDAVALLREPLGLAPEILDPWAGLSGGLPPQNRSGLAGGEDDLAAQALAGAVSSVVRSAQRAA